jgi:hypothetical protein
MLPVSRRIALATAAQAAKVIPLIDGVLFRQPVHQEMINGTSSLSRGWRLRPSCDELPRPFANYDPYYATCFVAFEPAAAIMVSGEKLELR